MNEEKLSSDAVPEKFSEWLLSMGCPVEKVPSVENIAGMCRGQYYMVWRSLMERVQPKDVIKEKRLQVFADDIRRCQQKNAFNYRQSNTLIPPELEQWKLQTDLKKKVDDMKSQLTISRQDLHQLMEKISSKMTQRNQSLKKAEDIQRRALFLQQVAEDLKSKQDNLEETKSIAEALCSGDEDVELQEKLDKCIVSLKRQNSQPALANPVASSSILSNGEPEIDENLLNTVVRNGGAALCSALYTRRAALIRDLAAPKTDHGLTRNTPKITPQSVLTHTASLHCQLALEAMKNKIHKSKVTQHFCSALERINNHPTSEACELLISRCELTERNARAAMLKNLYEDLVSRKGVFHTGGGETRGCGRSLSAIDKDIELKREETKRIIALISETESHINATRDCLASVFAQFAQTSAHTQLNSNYTIQSDHQSQSLSDLRHFYASRRELRAKRQNISLELDESDLSYDNAENCNPKLVDELNIYLKKFNLEKNRKLVLESGEKIWIFETLEWSKHRLQNKLLEDGISNALLSPYNSIKNSIMKLIDLIRYKEQLEEIMPEYCEEIRRIDISTQIVEEHHLNDSTKKRLNECLQDLQKTTKSLETVKNNINIWTDNKLKKYISEDRKLNGQSYREYERYYVENCLHF